jgi:hypothetical protein
MCLNPRSIRPQETSIGFDREYEQIDDYLLQVDFFSYIQQMALSGEGFRHDDLAKYTASCVRNDQVASDRFSRQAIGPHESTSDGIYVS